MLDGGKFRGIKKRENLPERVRGAGVRLGTGAGTSFHDLWRGLD